MLTQIQEKLYICPGQTHPISRSVHLSRLAAFYPACRDCPFRSETGQIPARTVERLQQTEHRVQRKSLLSHDGIRGIYLNELNRKKAEHYAAAFAGLLWQQSPLVGKNRSSRSTKHIQRSAPKRHSVVIGYDERPSSPDIVTGVAVSLRKMGCHVIDIGISTVPCFRFNVDHLQATAGIFVTGSGCDPSWTGLDFVKKNAVPLSAQDGTLTEEPVIANQELSLNQIENRMRLPMSRPTRTAGLQRTFQGMVPYEAVLWKHFDALRPLKFTCGSPSRLIQQLLKNIFAKLPCELLEVDIPQRARNFLDPEDSDLNRVGESVRENSFDLGVLIDDDSQRIAFLDEEGALIPATEITSLLAEFMLTDYSEGTIVVENNAWAALTPGIQAAGGICRDGGTSHQSMSCTLQEHAAIFGGGDSSRYWFQESFPTCDAILSLAKVLALLSRSDTPFSELVNIRREN
jgi:phosphomannomutase